MTDLDKKGPPASAGMVATLLSAGVLVVSILTDVDEPAWLTATGLCCLGLAVCFAVPPFVHLKRYGQPASGDAYFSTTRVVDRGVFALVRHPQYLGYTLLVLGFGCLDPHVLTVCLVVGAGISFYVQCVLEERFCSLRLGADYGEYMKRVPRFNFALGLYRIAKRRLM